MFKLEFSTENAAFEDENKVSEIAIILLNVRGKVLNGHGGGIVMDSNGNKVGSWELSDD
jgi:hypothetical protein